MLGKLLKYDLKAGCNIFGAIYGFIILCAVITRITAVLCGIEREGARQPGSAAGAFIYGISVFAMVICIIAACVVTLVWIVLRYRNNLLRDEGYLMHTLPVTPANLYFSKMFTALIIFAMDIVVIFVSVIISGVPGVIGFGWDDLVRYFTELHYGFSKYHINSTLFITGIIILLVSALYSSIAQIFFCLNAGYSFPSGRDTNRDLVSIAVYVVTYIVMQVAAFIVILAVAFISIGGIGFEFTNETQMVKYSFGILSFEIVLMFILSAVYSTASIKLMQKKLALG